MLIARDQTVLLGPPGTGKTTTLLNMVQEALDKGVQPEEIAFVSFTKKAVQEAADRACSKFNLKRKRLPLFQTVHSLCFQQLGCTKTNLLQRQNYIELGDWLGYDMSGQYDVGDGVLPTGASPGDKFLFLDNIARVKCLPVRSVWESEGFDVAWSEQERFSAGFQRYKDKNGLMDFTDLLHRYVEQGRPMQARIVFIDEAQDLSKAQWHVLQKAFAGAQKVIIAGDDDQSIYKWSGADLDTFLNLQGTQKILSVSHRLPRVVYEKAKGVIMQVRQRYTKEFTPRDAEGAIQYVTMLDQVDINPDEDTLILVRNVYLLKGIYEMLNMRGHTYTGRSGYASVKPAHVQAIVAWEHLRKAPGNTLSLNNVKEIYDQLRIGPMLARGGKAALECAEDTGHGFTLEILRELFGLTKEPLPVWHDAFEGIPLETREYYIAVLRSKRRISTPPRVHVNTIHGVKGGQADHVIIMSDMSKRTFMEMDKDIDSEHRVAFVALTRAKERLTIVLPQGKYAYPY
jgi:superfamily I DNA/RNA helicase